MSDESAQSSENITETVNEQSEQVKYEFDQAFQNKITSLFARANQFAQKTKDLISPDYFDNEAASALVRLVQRHLQEYKTIPDYRSLPTVIKAEIAAKRLRQDLVPQIIPLIKNPDLSDADYVADQVAAFARHQATEQAIMRSVDLLEKGEFDKIQELMRHAVNVGLNSQGDDYDYFQEIDNRTQMRKDIAAGRVVRNGITTGYSAIDAQLYHYGWGRKELSCMMGAAKAGKSMSLCDFTRNAALAGYNALYVTLEVASVIIADRMDAALSDFMVRELHKDPDKVAKTIKDLERRSGKIKLREFGSGSFKPSNLNRLIETYRNEGVIFDLIVVDYADIMAAEYRADQLRDNLREIYIDLRGLAFEHDVALLILSFGAIRCCR